jgi:heme exporter protein B
MIIPALMAAIQLTGTALAGDTIFGENYIWIKVLIGFDIIFTALAVALMDTVLIG